MKIKIIFFILFFFFFLGFCFGQSTQNVSQPNSQPKTMMRVLTPDEKNKSIEYNKTHPEESIIPVFPAQKQDVPVNEKAGSAKTAGEKQTNTPPDDKKTVKPK